MDKIHWVRRDMASVLDLMISVHRQRVDSLPVSVFNALGRAVALQEYCSLGINPGRQIGKTQFITTRASECDAIIAHNQSMCRHIVQSWQELCGNAKVFMPPVITLNKFLKYGHNGLIPKFDRIWFDEPCFTLGQESAFYECAARHEVKQIIMLGGIRNV